MKKAILALGSVSFLTLAAMGSWSQDLVSDSFMAHNTVVGNPFFNSIASLKKSIPDTTAKLASAAESVASDDSPLETQAELGKVDESINTGIRNALVPESLQNAYSYLVKRTETIKNSGKGLLDAVSNAASSVSDYARGILDLAATEVDLPDVEALKKTVNAVLDSTKKIFSGKNDPMNQADAIVARLQKSIEKDSISAMQRPFDSDVALLEKLEKTNKGEFYDKVIAFAKKQEDETAKFDMARNEFESVRDTYASYDAYVAKWGGWEKTRDLVVQVAAKKMERAIRDNSAYAAALKMPETGVEEMQRKLSQLSEYLGEYQDGRSFTKARAEQSRIAKSKKNFEDAEQKAAAAKAAEEEREKGEILAVLKNLEEEQFIWIMSTEVRNLTV